MPIMKSGDAFLMPRPPADPTGFVPTSAVLQRLHDEVPANHFTLGWLMHSLRKRSFGIIMLLLALVAVVPGLSIVAGLLLMIPAFQMIAGKPAPVFPRRIATRSLPTKRLAAVVQRSLPVLRYLEKVVHPRWYTPLEATKRLVGTVVVVLSATLVFIPIPAVDRMIFVGLTSDPASRLSASGAVPITIIERNGGCTIITGKTTTGTVAARWWIAAQDAPRGRASSPVRWRVSTATAAVQRSASVSERPPPLENRDGQTFRW
jgi:hypothetical protein